MTLIASSQSIVANMVQFVNETGKYPAIVVDGIDQGGCDLVVFGAPGSQPAKPGEPAKRLGAQFFGNVPFGQRAREGRQALYPYWEMA